MRVSCELMEHTLASSRLTVKKDLTRRASSRQSNSAPSGGVKARAPKVLKPSRRSWVSRQLPQHKRSEFLLPHVEGTAITFAANLSFAILLYSWASFS